MRIKFFMRLHQIQVNKSTSKNQTIIWQVLAENPLEQDFIEYMCRFLERETMKDLDGILTVLDNELIYQTVFLKNSFSDPKFLDYLVVGYISEKGGIHEINPIYKILEKINEFTAIPSNRSGITFSGKKFSEFYK
jgi:hypothetical protein